MKKVLLAVLALLILMMISAAGATEIFDTVVTGLPDDWTVTQSPSGAAEVALDENGDILLRFDTTQSSARANTRIITGYYTAQGDQIMITVTLDMNFSENVEGTLTLMDSSAQNRAELMTLGGSGEEMYSAEFFGGDYTGELASGTKLRFVIDSGDSVGALFIGDTDEPAFSGPLSSWIPELDFNNLRFLIQLRANSSIQESAWLKLVDFQASAFEGTYQFVSNPENGAQLVDAQLTEKIEIDFGLPVTEATRDQQNFTLYEEEVEIPFHIEADDSRVFIYPENGLSSDKAYLLNIAKVVDVYGNIREENLALAFQTAPENYTTPKISAVAEKNEIVEGDTALISFQVTEGEAIRTEVYVNDECVTEFTEPIFYYNFSADEAGEYSIYAKAYDNFGGVGVCESLLISVIENTAPVLTVEGISDGDSYAVGEVPTATIKAEDSHGIRGITVYLDGFMMESVTSDTMAFDLSEVSSGTHEILIRAEDAYGMYTEEIVTVTIETSLYIDYSFYDYSDYTGGTPPADHQGGPQRGYLAARQIDEEHGISAIIGIDTVNEEYVVGNGAYIGFPMNPSARKFSIEMELNVGVSPDSEDPFTFIVRGSGGMMTVAYIQPGQIWCQTGGSNPYTAGEWFQVKFVFDSVKNTFEYYANGEQIGGEKELPANIGSLDWLRIFSPNYDYVKTFVAVDNVKVTTICEAPVINMTQDVYEAGADSISFAIDGDLDFTSLSADKISISSEYGNVKIDSISLNGDVVTVKLGQKLEGNTNYKVTISGDVRFSIGAEVGASSSAVFRTSAGDLAVITGSYVSSGGMLQFEFDVQNFTGEETYIYVITQWSQNGRISRANVKRMTVASGAALQTFRLSNQFPKVDEEIKIFIVKGLDTPVPLSTEAYVYE